MESGIRRLSTTSTSTRQPSSVRSMPMTHSGTRPVSSASWRAAERAMSIALAFFRGLSVRPDCSGASEDSSAARSVARSDRSADGAAFLLGGRLAAAFLVGAFLAAAFLLGAFLVVPVAAESLLSLCVSEPLLSLCSVVAMGQRTSPPR